MNIKYLTDTEIPEMLNLASVKAALKSAFAGLASGMSVQPSQTVTVFPNNEGDCIFYPSVLWDSKIIGVKLSPYIVELSRKGSYPVTAYTVLMSAETGVPVLVCDALMLTTIRTAATTSLALDYLIPETARNLAVIGSGKIALHHLEYVSNQHNWSEIVVFSPSLTDKTSKRYADVNTKLETLGKNVSIPKSTQEAVESADVVLLCTSSGSPVIDYSWLKDKVTVTSVSTNLPKAHELPPPSLKDFAVFCDYRKTAPLSAGEMVIAKSDFGWDETSIVADIPELVTEKHKGVSATSGKVFFRSIGLGIEDLAIASLLI